MIEAVSFLALLGIAMPLKYLAGRPAAVRVVGMTHGLLFIVYVMALAQAAMTMRWPLKRVALLLVASVVPFGPFMVDGWLRDQYRLAGERESA
jgi:integral membrane protein